MRGFTLVELLVVIAIIAILASVIILMINPIELMKRSRDTARLKDLENLQQVINVTLSYPCTGKSNSDSRLTNGTGWVKTNLAAQNSVTVATLPVDPINDTTYHYTYCADNDTYELNAVLESDQFRSKMAMDGGNEADKYEAGSNYLLMSQGSCEY